MSCSRESRCEECWPDGSWKIEDTALKDVHATSFISECDVQLLCTAVWTFPRDVSTSDPDVAWSQDNYFYSKEKTKVTCKVCLSKMKA